MMNNVLDRIIANKRQEVEATKALVVPAVMREMAEAVRRQPMSMSGALSASPTGIIAECKRRSPSKGEIHPVADAAKVVGGYERGGATACSVLTDTPYFGGALSDLAVARATVGLPLLRKDFIVDEYQIHQARVYGADAILLIASALTREEIARFIAEAHRLGMETLLELHAMEELEKFVPDTDMVGVNNRNLSTFVTDTAISAEMARLLPAATVKVAESGLRTMDDVKALRELGYRGFLIGETFMKTADPGKTLKEFINGTV